MWKIAFDTPLTDGSTVRVYCNDFGQIQFEITRDGQVSTAELPKESATLLVETLVRQFRALRYIA